MKQKRFLIIGSFLFVLVLMIKFFSADSQRVEQDYSNGIYPFLSTFLRKVFGWIPFSIGDLLYGLIAVWILWKIMVSIRVLILKKATKKSFGTGVLKSIMALLIIYVVFNIFWGINYNRKGISGQLQLRIEKYNDNDLKNINSQLLGKVNSTKQSLLSRHESYPSSKQLFLKVQDAYSILDQTYPFLKYKTRSIKPSLWGWLGNYLGFTGYYNPFTGEAQVNTNLPGFIQPFTACHEVAHQLGYAKEMEANFVGFLAARTSADTLLQYSVYLDLFLYSNRNLYRRDSVAAKTYSKQLIPEVKADLKEWKSFSQRYKNPFEPVFRWLYGKFLERNEQPQGVLSYDEVTGFLIAYYKKFGKI